MVGVYDVRTVLGHAVLLGTLALGWAGCSLDPPHLLPRTSQVGTVAQPNPNGNLADAGPIRTPLVSGGAGMSGVAGGGGSSVPTIPKAAPQTGGLQCGGVACQFATAPMKPCCTTQDDVDQGSARAAGKCGVDYSATAASFFGANCWERNQPGIPDQTCEPLTISPGLTEPGCCSAGVCGGLNSSEFLGCHFQAGVKPKACGAPTVDTGTTCEPTGVFGVQSTVDVSWGGRTGGLVGLTDDGRAKIVIDLMVTVSEVDTSHPGSQGEIPIMGEVRTCSVHLPPFYSTTLCESYNPLFPDTIWESSKLPKIQLSGSYSCPAGTAAGEIHPGCTLNMDAKTYLLGIDLQNPEQPWPTPDQTATLPCAAGKGQQCFPDSDNDKEPGITIKMQTTGKAPPGVGCMDSGYAYQAPPLNSSPAAIFGGVKRADRLFLGTRTKLGGSGKISDDCMGGKGSGVAQFVESRAWGCYVQPGTADFPGPAAGPNLYCDASEALFLDQNMPIYIIMAYGQVPDSKLNVVDKSASKGPEFSMVRLGKIGDQVSCADVRNAKY